MKRIVKNVLGMLFIGVTMNLSAQDVKIENGSQFKVTSLETIQTVINVEEGQSSFLTKSGLLGRKFRVLNLDGSLNLESKHEIELPKIEGKKVKFISAQKLGESVYFMSRYYDRKAKTYYLFASELDPTNGKFKRHLEAMSLKTEKSISGNPFAITRSIDSTKVLISVKYRTKRNEKVRYGFKVVNNDMSEVWSKDVVFDEPGKEFSLIDTEIDKNGNIHLVARMLMTRAEKKDSDVKSRSYVDVYSYFHKEDVLKQYKLGFTNEIIRTIDLDVNEDNELIGMGFYSDKKVQFGDSYKGFFFLKINPDTKEVVVSKKTAFSKDLIAELIGKRKGERKAKKGKFPTYVVRKSIPLSNGGYAVVAEHYVYSRLVTRNSKGQQVVNERWLFGNVVVMYMDKEGNMTTASVLKKKQTCSARNGNGTASIELAYYGISVMEKDNNIYLLYNEDPKNEARLKEGKKTKNVKQKTSVTMLMTFTPDGEIHGNVLFKSKDKKAGVKMPLMPRSYQQYSEGATILFGKKGKKMRVSRVTIK